ncbi:MAG: DUF1573 domain-containing protein [Bacteroidaceae bacterium]|nr:DUF1573 domain-containing protein [Bacteroidaceae bacterium]
MTVGAAAMAYSYKPTVNTPKELYAEITFDTLKIDLGTFPESDPERRCSFQFTNTGDKPLVINQAFASCGCTVPNYPKAPIKPGERGAIDVTYNGSGKFPGKFAKTITVRSNARNEIVRLTISGVMTEK